MYRVTHLLADLGWVGFDLGSFPGLIGQLVAAHQPWNIPNQSQPYPVRQEMCHPVEKVGMD